MNFTLQEIGSTLMGLTSDTVFKASDGSPSDCFIKKVWIWNGADSLLQVGTFHDDTSNYFIIVNRLEAVVGLSDTTLFLYDCYNHEVITYEYIIGMSQPPYYYRIKLKPGQGRLFRLIPFEHEFRINQNQGYTNMRFAALRTKATSSLGVDSMKIYQNYNDSLIDSTGWIVYDTAYCWYLRQSAVTNTVYIKYKVDGNIVSPEYSDVIKFDTILPTGSFVINDNDKFTNNPTVTLKNSFNDTSMSKMRFGNRYLKNLLKNSAFNTTSHWQMDTAIYHDSLKLYEIPVQTTGNYFYQTIPPESLSEFVDDTLLLWTDLVGDDFVGTGKIQFQYIYSSDTVVRHIHPYGTSITIPQGTKAKVSHYNLYSYFKYHPEPPPGERFIEARVGVFVDSAGNNEGNLFIDNFRLDVVSPYNGYTRFENYDTVKTWTLDAGNGSRKVYGQFSDGAGNETDVLYDTIIVDTTKPTCKIEWPHENQTVSGTIYIKGYAHDSLDATQYFKKYELRYQKYLGIDQTWYAVYPDSVSTSPVYPNMLSPDTLGRWITDTTTRRHGDGWYWLRIVVEDSAANADTHKVKVKVDNSGGGEKSAGFDNEIYGLAAGNWLYIGELSTGNVYVYDTNYILLDTFKLVDSVGIGLPFALAIDDSGKIWVTNITSNLINQFTPQGELLLQFAGDFNQPSGIAFDNSGNIWITDRLHHKVKKFNFKGDSLFAFGMYGSEPSEIDKPIGIAFYKGKLYIADSENRRVSVFDTLGEFIKIIGESSGLVMPFGLAIDSTGCIFVSDFMGDKVLEFDPYGDRLYTIDTILDGPTGLAVSKDAKILYVSDSKNRQVLSYAVRGEPPDSNAGGPQSLGDAYRSTLMFEVYPSIFSRQLKIRLQDIEPAGVKEIALKIYDVTGRLIKSFRPALDALGATQIQWDGTDDLNRKLPCGVYFIRLETEDYKGTKKAILLR